MKHNKLSAKERDKIALLIAFFFLSILATFTSRQFRRRGGGGCGKCYFTTSFQFLQAAQPGFEPGLDDPESSVLPLDDRAYRLYHRKKYPIISF